MKAEYAGNSGVGFPVCFLIKVGEDKLKKLN